MKALISLTVGLMGVIWMGAAQAVCPAALNFSATPLTGERSESLCRFSGKVVLVVNTASACGFTPQYDGLEKLYNEYKGKGLVVLGFPANDFGGQESGSNAAIATFCKINFGVTFPMYEKLKTPIKSDPLFANLRVSSGSAPVWNFHKYLIDKQGKVTGFASDVEPQSTTLKKALDIALK
jgi:glutathione peroxidase